VPGHDWDTVIVGLSPLEDRPMAAAAEEFQATGPAAGPDPAIVSRRMRERRLLASVLAVIATAGAALLRALLAPWLGFELPYITFFGAVMAAAWYGGMYPGLLATVLSAVAAVFWFVLPAWSLAVNQPFQIIGVIIFVLTGALMSVAAERLLSVRRQIEALRARDHNERSAADRARALLAAVVESSEDAILTKSLQGTILSWNAGAEQMFGYPASEAVGSHVGLIVPPGRRDEEADILARVSRGERVLPFETERVAKNGTVLDVSVTLSPIRGDSGAIIGASSIARDIGARKALEGSLRDADRRKDDFLAVLAHELRNPLAPVRSSVALLKLGASTTSIGPVADVIDRQTRHMARLLDDLLDVSRITRGRLELRRERVGLHEVIDAALETTRPMFDTAGQPVAVTLPPPPVILDGDPVRLAQVFANILSNASKYSDRGARVTIEATAGPGEVVVRVIDQGVGIDPPMLQRVFEMFSQASQTVNRAQGGLGIGLALVRGLVDLHGGQVTAESAGPGSGSCFTVTLPVTERPLGTGVAGPATFTAGTGRVLVVDDNRDGADSLALVLRAHGYTVRTAYTGEEALAIAGGFQPRAILLDLGMPGLDGYATARRLRAAPAGPSPFLVAVTGWGQDRDRRLTSEAGFDAHLVKPVDVDDLTALLQAALA
jgi:PAS domain S-box-containing protein